MTKDMLINNKPFNPSIKFDPLINISKQKEVKKMLKTEFSKKLSKKFNLEDEICKSNKITENKTNANWKKNLFFGEIKILRSENKPTEKIRIKIIIQIMLSSIVSINGRSKKKPPTKGIFFWFENN